MGRLKLMPRSNVLPLNARVLGRAEPNGQAEPKANGYRPTDLEPPLPLTPQRIELIKTFAENLLWGTEGSPASQIARRFAPRAQGRPPSDDPPPASQTQQPAPFSALASGISRLTVVLVSVALLPNLTLAAFWLRVIDPPRSQPETLPLAESHTPAVPSAILSPVVSAPETLEAKGVEEVILPIALDGTDGVPPGSVIVIRGLPQASTLSNGRRTSETEWTLKPDEIGDLHLALADSAKGESKLTIQLLAPNNGILADAATTLKIEAGPKSSIAAHATDAEPEAAQVFDAPGQEPDVASAGPATSASDIPPLPTRRPLPSSNDDGQASWISPSAYVNLRQSPSSSAPVVGVIAKGLKLRVIGRKSGWVQVTNPGASQSGWIYSGNVDSVR